MKCVGAYTFHSTHMKVTEQFCELDFSFYLYMGSGERTQVTKLGLGQQALLPAEPSCYIHY